MSDIHILQALNQAIWLRNNAQKISKQELIAITQEIGEYQIYSARQIAKIVNNKLSHQTIAKLCNKTQRTGGRLNVLDLENIKECFHDRINKTVDDSLVRLICENGTSQGVLSKLTGISQTKISKVCTK